MTNSELKKKFKKGTLWYKAYEDTTKTPSFHLFRVSEVHKEFVIFDWLSTVQWKWILHDDIMDENDYPHMNPANQMVNKRRFLAHKFDPQNESYL
jgi:hypothetical protein